MRINDKRGYEGAFLAMALLAFLLPPAPAQILSAKRGIGDAGASYDLLQAVNAGWYYTWGTGLQYPGNHEALHIPMFRWWTSIPGHVDWILNRPEPTKWVMCFNEPERPDQDNLSVADAISRCWEIANGLAGSGIKIAGPGVADTGDGQLWLADFMSQANAQGLPIDGVCFHWHGVANPYDPVGAAYSFLSRVDSYHNSYGLPVFITEFAIHDWGGAFSVDEMKAANATFLSIAIPGLESRSYVEGYAWHNWFSDSPLVEGNPLKPTSIGLQYVCVLNTGDVYDFSGDDLGEHVAYLSGGELTHDSAGGVLHYINALSGTCTISGNVDWSLAGTNWVRIQPGATLRKTGTNQIAWSGTTVNNNNVIEIADGELIFDDCTMGSSGTVRVEAGATASHDASHFVIIGYDVELDGGTMSCGLPTGIRISNGGSVSGDGAVNSPLGVVSGALL